MSYYRYRKWSYTLDDIHGFGIMYRMNNEQKKEYRVYYEDDTLEPCQKTEREETLESSIRCIKEQEDKRWVRYSAKEKAELEAILAEGSCQFQPIKNGLLKVVLKGEKNEYEISADERGFLCR